MSLREETASCCPNPGREAIVDFDAVGGAKPFLERAELIRAYRNPEPRLQPGASRVHTIPLKSPLPLPELQGHFVGEPPPDQGKTLGWPHPDLESEEG